MKDVTHRFAPFGADTAREMIGEIKGAAMLTGYRGRPALDVAALADTLARLSLSPRTTRTASRRSTSIRCSCARRA